MGTDDVQNILWCNVVNLIWIMEDDWSIKQYQIFYIFTFSRDINQFNEFRNKGSLQMKPNYNNGRDPWMVWRNKKCLTIGLVVILYTKSFINVRSASFCTPLGNVFIFVCFCCIVIKCSKESQHWIDDIKCPLMETMHEIRLCWVKGCWLGNFPHLYCSMVSFCNIIRVPVIMT